MCSSFAADSAVLQTLGEPLQIVSSTISLPLRGGTALVKILIAEVGKGWKAVFSGRIPLKLPVPLIPGASGVGVVEAIADDVFGVAVNDLILMDSLHTTAAGNRLLIGFGPVGAELNDPNSAKQVGMYKNGTWATRAVLPASSLFVIPSDFLKVHVNTTIEQLLRVRNLCVSHGAILASEFEAGDCVLVNGATGNFGGFVVLLLLLLNAGHVYVMGRNEKDLQRLVALDPQRVHAVTVVLQPDTSLQLEGKKEVLDGHGGNMQLLEDAKNDAKKDAAKVAAVVDQVKKQLGKQWQCVDRFIDFLGATNVTASISAGIQALRVGGFASLAGGVFGEFPLSYAFLLGRQLTVRGSFMSPRSSFHVVTALLPRLFDRFGRLFAQTDFDGIQQVNMALDSASSNAPLHATFMYPNSKAAAQHEIKQRTK